jgi:hypothetical protein
MREIILNAGGRFLFNEDIIDLQSHTAAMHNIFASETPFVISGMTFTEVATDTYDISAGYVWLGEKIRHYAGATSVDFSVDQFLNVADSTESRLYDDGITRTAIAVNGLVLSTTGAGGTNQLQVNGGVGVRRYYENVLGDKYLLVDAAETQQVLSAINFQGSITSSGTISTSSSLSAANLTITGNASVNTLSIGLTPLFDSSAKLLAANSITEGNITDLNITTDKIQDLAVTNAKIGDQVITKEKIAPLTITEGKIQDGAVTNAKLGDGAVTNPKIGDDAVQSAQIKDGVVTTSKLNFAPVKFLAKGQYNFTSVNAGSARSFSAHQTHNLGLSGWMGHYKLTFWYEKTKPIFLFCNNWETNHFIIGASYISHQGDQLNEGVTVFWEISLGQ